MADDFYRITQAQRALESVDEWLEKLRRRGVEISSDAVSVAKGTHGRDMMPHDMRTLFEDALKAALPDMLAKIREAFADNVRAEAARVRDRLDRLADAPPPKADPVAVAGCPDP